MFRNYVLGLHTSRRHETIAVRVSIRRAQITTTPRRGLDVIFDTARNAAGLIDVTAKPSQSERVNRETLECNHALQACIEICRAKPRAVARHSLIETGVNADCLLGAQRWITKPRETQSRKSPLSKSFKKRRRAKAVADVRAEFCVCRAKEISDRAIASKRPLRRNRAQKTGAIRSADAEELAARAQRNLQAIVEQKDLILAEHGDGSLPVGRVVNRAERWDQ